MIENGREPTGLDVVQWAQRCEELGAGEIMLTSIDRDGTRNGYDLDLVSAPPRHAAVFAGSSSRLPTFDQNLTKTRPLLCVCCSLPPERHAESSLSLDCLRELSGSAAAAAASGSLKHAFKT